MDTAQRGRDLVDEIARLADRLSVRIAVAESLTAGRLAAELGAGPGAAGWFRGGIVAYSEEVKFDVLGVPRGPVVSPTAAKAMAGGVAELLGAELAVAVTGAGGPGSQDGAEPGTVWFAVGAGGRVETHRCWFPGTPEQVLSLTTQHALALLVARLREDAAARSPRVDPQAFESLTGLLDYPMYIVTAEAGDLRAGCLVGFATQVSIVPARFLVAISRSNHTLGVARRAPVLGVHLVPRERHDLAELFGGRTGDEVDKFARCRWSAGPGGAPILTDAAGWFEGRVLEQLDLGDHVGFLLAPDGGAAPAGACDFLGFPGVRDLEPGHPA